MRVRYQAAPHPELNLSTRVWDAMTIHVHPNVIYLSRGGRIRTYPLIPLFYWYYPLKFLFFK